MIEPKTINFSLGRISLFVSVSGQVPPPSLKMRNLGNPFVGVPYVTIEWLEIT